MKTIQEWLNELPEDVRDKAIANTDKDLLEINLYNRLSHALEGAFVWALTPEGWDYWDKIHDSL
jgi:hypothetical protein